MNILRIRCRDADEFRTHYSDETGCGRLFCPVTTEVEVGAAVVVELICKVLPNRVLIRGTVVSWRKALPRKRIRAGAFVDIDPDEAQKRDFVLETLGGKRVPTPKRKHTRIPLGQPIRILIGSGTTPQIAELREISVIGGLIYCALQPDLGTDVVLQVVPPGGARATDISGRVLYHAGEGLTGIKFLFREGGGSRRLRELVRRFKTG